MKRIGFVLLTVFSLQGNLQAQKLELGPELGTNLILIQKTDYGRNYHLGWFAGGNVEYHITDFFSLRSGLYFSQRKKRYESFDTTGFTFLGIDFSEFEIPGIDFNVYKHTQGVTSQFGIELPILVSVNYKGFGAFAGPYIHAMVGAWTKETTDTRIPFLDLIDIDSLDPTGFIAPLFPPAQSSEFLETSSKENLNCFDYGFKAGLSYTRDQLRLNFYYVNGIPDYRLDRGNLEVNPHRFFSFSINYNFGFRKATPQSSFQ